ncbi:MAG: DUF1611 domain-containing protein [Candidatus Glassbacteria bacterium]|nr:DUF1611 domain-containing protein [Candidatus Glassbacteria bacterium]
MVRTVLLCEGAFDDFGVCKTAYGVLRFAAENIVAVIDSKHAGKDSSEVSRLGEGIPVVGSLEEAMAFAPERMLIGVATVGGVLNSGLRGTVAEALEKGLEVHNGLHEMLAEVPDLAAAAKRGGGGIVDLRAEPKDLECASLKAQDVAAFVVLMVGTDCNAGKMTAALELLREAENQGIKSAFCATGQTGIAIAGQGIAIDHVLSDFTAGAAERLVVEAGADKKVELIAIEGQGALAQPVYSGVTLSLMHGSLPDAMILCHRAGQDLIEIVETPMPPLAEHIRLYEETMKLVKPSRVVAIALNAMDLSEDEARRELKQVSADTGLPATDPSRFGAGVLLDAVRSTGMNKVPLYRGKKD